MSLLSALLPERAYRWNFTVMGLDYSLSLLGLILASVYGVLPLFVHHLTPSNLELGLIVADDGVLLVREGLSGPASDPGALGEHLAQRLLQQGAAEILRAGRAAGA